MKIFNASELELLICGQPKIDVEDLKANTEYSNYTENSPQIQWFWKLMKDFSEEQKAWFLSFVTGTTQVPLDGFKVGQRISALHRMFILVTTL